MKGKDKGRISYILRLKLLRGNQLVSELQFLRLFERWIPEVKKCTFFPLIYNCTFPGKRIVTIVALAIGCQWTSNHIVHCAIGAGKTVTFTLTSTTFVIRNGLQGNILESYLLLFQFISRFIAILRQAHLKSLIGDIWIIHKIGWTKLIVGIHKSGETVE